MLCNIKKYVYIVVIADKLDTCSQGTADLKKKKLVANLNVLFVLTF